MPRTANATDFKVEVPKLGTFIFARRTIGDTFKIRGKYNQLTDGNYSQNGDMNDLVALAYATIQTLLVSAPTGFDLDNLDPLVDDEFELKLFDIFKALRLKESDFRPKSKANSEAAGQGNGEVLSAVVSREIQPSTNG